MSINVTLLNSSDKLTPYKEVLDSEINKALARIEDFFELSKIDITVSPFQKGEESPSGLGGYALSEHRVELLVDCSRKDLTTAIQTELQEVLAHEIHHCLRLKADMPSLTLAELLVMEGQACLFEHTVSNGKPSSLFSELQDYDWRDGLEKMRPLLSSSDFVLNKLFLGSHPDEFPKYAGYWIGFNLIKHYAQHHNATDADLIEIEAKDFIDFHFQNIVQN